ncbi:MAG: MFS transporter [Bryobacteraceae bacterium]|jgi:putative MFS transporter
MDDAIGVSSEKAAAIQGDGLPEIGARLDRLASSRVVWRLMILLAFGGFFDAYMISSGGNIAPGLFRSHILTATTAGFFSLKGYAGFTAATFLGLLVASSGFAIIADRFGRRTVFTIGLLWFSACGVMMGFQNTANGIIFWRFMLAVGTGLEVITIDAYLSELVPKRSRGRAFAINNAIHSTGQPLAALAAFSLVPYHLLGVDGWRWVVMLGAAGAVAVWPLRMFIPESPRWLAAHGKLAAADRIVTDLETRVEREIGHPLPAPEPVIHRPPHKVGRYSQIFGPEYLPRTVMLSLFHLLQAFGLYGFIAWMPTFLIKQGISITSSLGYTFGMALVAPFGGLVCLSFADKFERKWQIVGAALAIAAAGLVFAASRNPLIIVPAGGFELLSAAVLSFNFHAYQSELFPTRIRVQAIGFVYSWSRVSAAFSAFVVAWVLGNYGAPAVFLLFTASMLLVALAIATLGPLTKQRSLETLSP